jgi:hypothetical protein
MQPSVSDLLIESTAAIPAAGPDPFSGDFHNPQTCG